jgi:hypothetical protein
MFVLILIYILNVIDYYETIYLIQNCGIDGELNPVMRFLVENDYAWGIKIIGVAILMIIYAIILIIGKDKKHMWGAYVLLTAYSVTVLSNLYFIWRAGLLPPIENFL